jgi:hypothetical protein
MKNGRRQEQSELEEKEKRKQSSNYVSLLHEESTIG